MTEPEVRKIIRCMVRCSTYGVWNTERVIREFTEAFPEWATVAEQIVGDLFQEEQLIAYPNAYSSKGNQ